MKAKHIIAAFFIIIAATSIHAQSCTEHWVDKGARSSSGKYIYIIGEGATLKQAIIEAVVNGGVSVGQGGISESEIRDSFSNRNGEVEISQGISSTLKIAGRNLQYAMIDNCQSYGSHKALVMLRKEQTNRIRPLPKPNRHLPVSFLLSAVVPGSGQFYKKQTGKGWLFLAGTAAFGGAAFYFDTERKASLDAFDAASTFESRELFIDQIKTNQDYRNIALAAAGAMYLINVIDAFASKSRRYAYDNSRRVNWNLAYLPNSNTPFASLSIKIGDRH